MLEGRDPAGVLAGKTVWIVEPERFSSHALEAALGDLEPRAIVPIGSIDEARTRLDLVGPNGVPSLAVIDFTGEGDAGVLARDLTARGTTVVRTVPPNGLPGSLAGSVAETVSATERAAGLPPMDDVRRPYAPSEVAGAIARHYGLTT